MRAQRPARSRSLASLLVSATIGLSAASGVTAGAQAPTDDASARWEFANIGGLHFFGPTRASIALGAGLRREGHDALAKSRMLFALIEPGLGALRLSGGYGEAIGSLAGGWSARASLLQLTRVAKSPRYWGLELQAIPLACLGTRIGAFRPLERNAGRRTTLWLADFSICL